MNMCIIIFVVVLSVAYGKPIPQEDEIQGEIATPPPGRWQGAWETAKSFFGKIAGYVGGNDAGTMLTRIGQATTFYNMLRENPQQLIENLKYALANALSQAALNPSQAQQLQKDAAVLKKQLQLASASVNGNIPENNQGSDSESEIAGEDSEPRIIEPAPELNEDN